MTAIKPTAPTAANHAAETSALIAIVEDGPMGAHDLVDVFGSVYLAGLALGFVRVMPEIREGTGTDELDSCEANDFDGAWRDGAARAAAGLPIPFAVSESGRVSWFEDRL